MQIASIKILKKLACKKIHVPLVSSSYLLAVHDRYVSVNVLAIS